MRLALLITVLFLFPVSAIGQGDGPKPSKMFTVDGIDESEGDCERMTDQISLRGRLGGIEEHQILEQLSPLKVGKSATGEDAYCVKHFLRECPRVLESYYFRNGYPETRVEIEVSSSDDQRPFLLVCVSALKGCEVGKVTVESDGGVGTVSVPWGCIDKDVRQ